MQDDVLDQFQSGQTTARKAAAQVVAKGAGFIVPTKKR
jgi:hypothetical protein